MGASDGTVRKHIQQLESEGVVKGYSANVGYQKSGYPLRILLYCATSIPKRGELALEILKMDGIAMVQELVTSE